MKLPAGKQQADIKFYIVANLCLTFSVDDATDVIMQRIIRQKFAKHTILAVAHKLDTIVDFDKVAVLSNGVVREFDNPNALLNDPASAFSQLYRS